MDGVQYGTSCKRATSVPMAVPGTLVTWPRNDVTRLQRQHVAPQNEYLLNGSARWEKSPFLLSAA
eukprot:1131205-Lingulodinium_polyedra.AAC.1